MKQLIVKAFAIAAAALSFAAVASEASNDRIHIKDFEAKTQWATGDDGTVTMPGSETKVEITKSGDKFLLNLDVLAPNSYNLENPLSDYAEISWKCDWTVDSTNGTWIGSKFTKPDPQVRDSRYTVATSIEVTPRMMNQIVTATGRGTDALTLTYTIGWPNGTTEVTAIKLMADGVVLVGDGDMNVGGFPQKFGITYEMTKNLPELEKWATSHKDNPEWKESAGVATFTILDDVTVGDLKNTANAEFQDWSETWKKEAGVGPTDSDQAKIKRADYQDMILSLDENKQLESVTFTANWKDYLWFVEAEGTATGYTSLSNAIDAVVDNSTLYPNVNIFKPNAEYTDAYIIKDPYYYTLANKNNVTVDLKNCTAWAQEKKNTFITFEGCSNLVFKSGKIKNDGGWALSFVSSFVRSTAEITDMELLNENGDASRALNVSSSVVKLSGRTNLEATGSKSSAIAFMKEATLEVAEGETNVVVKSAQSPSLQIVGSGVVLKLMSGKFYGKVGQPVIQTTYPDDPIITSECTGARFNGSTANEDEKYKLKGCLAKTIIPVDYMTYSNGTAWYTDDCPYGFAVVPNNAKAEDVKIVDTTFAPTVTGEEYKFNIENVTITNVAGKYSVPVKIVAPSTNLVKALMQKGFNLKVDNYISYTPLGGSACRLTDFEVEENGDFIWNVEVTESDLRDTAKKTSYSGWLRKEMSINWDGQNGVTNTFIVRFDSMSVKLKKGDVQEWPREFEITSDASGQWKTGESTITGRDVVTNIYAFTEWDVYRGENAWSTNSLGEYTFKLYDLCSKWYGPNGDKDQIFKSWVSGGDDHAADIKLIESSKNATPTLNDAEVKATWTDVAWSVRPDMSTNATPIGVYATFEEAYDVATSNNWILLDQAVVTRTETMKVEKTINVFLNKNQITSTFDGPLFDVTLTDAEKFVLRGAMSVEDWSDPQLDVYATGAAVRINKAGEVDISRLYVESDDTVLAMTNVLKSSVYCCAFSAFEGVPAVILANVQDIDDKESWMYLGQGSLIASNVTQAVFAGLDIQNPEGNSPALTMIDSTMSIYGREIIHEDLSVTTNNSYLANFNKNGAKAAVACDNSSLTIGDFTTIDEYGEMGSGIVFNGTSEANVLAFVDVKNESYILADGLGIKFNGGKLDIPADSELLVRSQGTALQLSNNKLGEDAYTITAENLTIEGGVFEVGYWGDDGFVRYTGINTGKALDSVGAKDDIPAVTNFLTVAQGKDPALFSTLVDKAYPAVGYETADNGLDYPDTWYYALTKTYQISYELDGGAFTNTTTELITSYTITNSVALQYPRKRYHDFIGWYNAAEDVIYSNGVWNAGLDEIGDVTLLAIWQYKETRDVRYFDVAFTPEGVVTNDITAVVQPQSEDEVVVTNFTKDTTWFNVAAAYERADFTFNGWFDKNGKQWTKIIPGPNESVGEEYNLPFDDPAFDDNGVLCLYNVQNTTYFENVYTIKYDAGSYLDGTSVGSTEVPEIQYTILAEGDVLATLETPIRNSYLFEGWYTNGAKVVDNQILRHGFADGDLTAVANWVAFNGEPALAGTAFDNVQDAAQNFSCWMIKDGEMCGIASVKATRATKYNKFVSTVTATVTALDDSKVQTLTGKAPANTDGPSEVTLVSSKSDKLVANLQIGDLGVEGTYVDKAFVGGIVPTKAETMDFQSKAWSVAFVSQSTGCGSTMSITFGQAGKATVKGTLSDGTKYSTTAQLVLGRDVNYLPVCAPMYSRKGGFACLIEFAKDGSELVTVNSDNDGALTWYQKDGGVDRLRYVDNRLVVNTYMSGTTVKTDKLEASEIGMTAKRFYAINITDDVIKALDTATSTKKVENVLLNSWSYDDSALYGEIDIVKDKFTFKGTPTVRLSNGAFDQASFDKTYAAGKTNVPGLKLTYTPSTGLLTGSFKVYVLQTTTTYKSNGDVKSVTKSIKTYTANVTATLNGSTFLGTAQIKNVGAFPVVFGALLN